MAIARTSLADLLDRAAQDPELLHELAVNPLEVAISLGLHLTGSDLKTLLGLDGATDAELLEVLQIRLARHTDGCGGCDVEIANRRA